MNISVHNITIKNLSVNNGVSYETAYNLLSILSQIPGFKRLKQRKKIRAE